MYFINILSMQYQCNSIVLLNNTVIYGLGYTCKYWDITYAIKLHRVGLLCGNWLLAWLV